MIPLSFVRAALDGVRVDLSSEKRAQADIAKTLSDRLPGVLVEREVRISSRDIVDVLVEESYVVEVKLRGWGKAAIFRQLRRYCAHDQVRGLVLVTNMAMGLPEEIEGKPTSLVSLGRSWL